MQHPYDTVRIFESKEGPDPILDTYALVTSSPCHYLETKRPQGGGTAYDAGGFDPVCSNFVKASKKFQLI